MYRPKRELTGDEHHAMTSWCETNIHFTDWGRLRPKKWPTRLSCKIRARVNREWRVIEVRWRGRHTVHGEIIQPSPFALWLEQHPLTSELST